MILKVIKEYGLGIMALGALAKGTDLIEGRAAKKQAAEKKSAEEAWHWVEKKVGKGKNKETKMFLVRTVSRDELDSWIQAAEDRKAESEGLVIARRQKAAKPEPPKRTMGDAGKAAGKFVGDVAAAGVKARVRFELRDRSRDIAKKAKDQEVFLANNVRNKMSGRGELY